MLARTIKTQDKRCECTKVEAVLPEFNALELAQKRRNKQDQMRKLELYFIVSLHIDIGATLARHIGMHIANYTKRIGSICFLRRRLVEN